MTTEIADQFKGLPIAHLISAPLLAACDAQLRLANATADFIKVIGFLPPALPTPPAVLADDAVGATRTASFKFTRPTTPAIIADPNATPPVIGVPAGFETVNLDVPMLAIVNIPALSVKSVDIIFDMEVKSSTSMKSSKDESVSGSVDASAKWGAVKVAVHVQGSVASHQENTRSTDNSAKYHVEVHAVDVGASEGLRRVLDIMNSAIVPVKV